MARVIVVGLLLFVFSVSNAQVSPVDFSSQFQTEDHSKPALLENSKSDQTESSRLPDPAKRSNEQSSVDVAKRSAMEAMSVSLRLFSPTELLAAYNDVKELGRELASFDESKNSKVWRTRLFDDRSSGATSVACINYLKSYYGTNTESDTKNTNYTKELSNFVGKENYTELHFCLDYIGLSLDDALICQAYLLKKKSFVKALFENKRSSVKRLNVYILALDIQLTLCSSFNALNFRNQ